ncbi:RWD-domain-containing protein [Dacryopinax primogenitus]|uniref:RWD-domain-containing protein n=1 Tax=Dacryopinax primogenitus (strain DJM 731) TaxID=1858805 RepID=M5FYP5_DACPD|nr:RWD-domain-containing protein [Dacryopinax primogenitus]EJT96627.1 RWD-domain-containing protein [Dacryopinax primogenitus]
MSQTLQEEFEVLESIFPEELERISQTELKIRVEPDASVSSDPPVVLSLHVSYPPIYPSEIPKMQLEEIEGELTELERDVLLSGLRLVGEDSLGMAMVFTLVTHLQSAMSALLQGREEDIRAAEEEKARLDAEAEANRNKGTAVTAESFARWKEGFNAEVRKRTEKEEEEKMRGMTPKERDEFKRSKTKLTGRQLFERDRNLGKEEDALGEEGAESVDISKYDRTEPREEEEEEEVGIEFEDSD